MCVYTHLSENVSYLFRLHVETWAGGLWVGDRGKGLTSSEPDGFHDTHAFFNLAGGSERTATPCLPLYLQILRICSVPVRGQ